MPEKNETDKQPDLKKLIATTADQLEGEGYVAWAKDLREQAGIK